MTIAWRFPFSPFILSGSLACGESCAFRVNLNSRLQLILSRNIFRDTPKGEPHGQVDNEDEPLRHKTIGTISMSEQ